MESVTIGGIAFWQSRLLSREVGLVHGLTQRDTNMALSVGPDIGGSAARRRRVCHALSIPFDRLTLGRQVHGGRVVVVDGDSIGAGRDRSKPRIAEVDGLVTDEPDVPLVALTADCCLVTVYDPVRHAVGVAHAGWRGTAAKISGALVETLAEAYGCTPDHCIAMVGPCARACCYEVGDDVVSAFGGFNGAWGDALETRGGRTFLDLGTANRIQLHAAGLSSDRIDLTTTCTICDDRFYSYRREGRSVGQSAMIVSLKL